jgi:hypothetical protein
MHFRNVSLDGTYLSRSCRSQRTKAGWTAAGLVLKWFYMIQLSYTTLNALIHEPHTFICRYQLNLPKFTTLFLERGKDLHRIVQDHVSGRKEHPALAHLPYFPHVEQTEYDRMMEVRFPINEEYSFHGFLDGMNPQTRQFLEIKTGSHWSKDRFLRLVQWKLYAVARPAYTDVVFVNCPASERAWTPRSIAVYTHRITERDKAEAQAFIDHALDVIAHLDQQKLYVNGRSKYCFYQGCPYCSADKEPVQLPRVDPTLSG